MKGLLSTLFKQKETDAVSECFKIALYRSVINLYVSAWRQVLNISQSRANKQLGSNPPDWAVITKSKPLSFLNLHLRTLGLKHFDLMFDTDAHCAL